MKPLILSLLIALTPIPLAAADVRVSGACQTGLDYTAPKTTNAIQQPHGVLKYALLSGRIYLCSVTQTEAGGQNKLIQELKQVAALAGLPIQVVVKTPERQNFFTNRGFAPVSRSREMGYTVMVWG